MEAATIYGLYDPRSMQCRYVGKTKGHLSKRLRGHVYDAQRGIKRHTSNWIRSLLSDGLLPEIFEIETSSDCWRERERFWIEYMRFIGCNLTNTDPGGGGIEMSDEIKMKISSTRREKNLAPSQAAQINSLAARKKLWKDSAYRSARSAKTSETQKVIWQDPDHRKKMSEMRRASWSAIKSDPAALADRKRRMKDSASACRSAKGEGRNAKLKAEQVHNIRFQRAFGLTFLEISVNTGIPFGTVYAICIRKTWAHIA